MHYGIDVSAFQHPHGAAIDWPAVYAALKAEGGGADPFVFINEASPYFARDYADAVAAGFRVASYDYYAPANDAGADEAHFRSVVGGVPGAEDLEESDGLSWEQVAAKGRQWLAEKGEARSLLYSNLNYLENMAGAPWGHPIWFAGTIDPATNPHTAGTVIWQYGTGPVPGIQGQVDLDRWVGSEDQFAQFFALAAPAPAPAAPPVPLPPITEDDMQNLLIIHDTTSKGWRLWNTAVNGWVNFTGDQPEMQAWTAAGVRVVEWPGADSFDPVAG